MAQSRRLSSPRDAINAHDLAQTCNRDIHDRMCSPVRNARLAVGMTQEQLKVASKLTQATISKVENRGCQIGHLELATARALADALGTTVDALFPRTGGGR